MTGLTIYNNSNTIQIDQNFGPLTFVGKHTMTITDKNTDAAGNVTYYSNASAYFAANTPLIVLAGTDVGTVLYFSNEYISNVAGANTWVVSMGCSNSSVATFYVFDSHATPRVPHGDAGLEVYDANGHVLYSSASQPLKIVDFIQNTNAPSIYGNHLYTAGNTYAGLVVTQSYTVIRQGGGTGPGAGGVGSAYYVTGVAAISGGIALGQCLTGSGIGGPGANTTVVGILVIDTTNYTSGPLSIIDVVSGQPFPPYP